MRQGFMMKGWKNSRESLVMSRQCLLRTGRLHFERWDIMMIILDYDSCSTANPKIAPSQNQQSLLIFVAYGQEKKL